MEQSSVSGSVSLNLPAGLWHQSMCLTFCGFNLFVYTLADTRYLSLIPALNGPNAALNIRDIQHLIFACDVCHLRPAPIFKFVVFLLEWIFVTSAVLDIDNQCYINLLKTKSKEICDFSNCTVKNTTAYSRSQSSHSSGSQCPNKEKSTRWRRA